MQRDSSFNDEVSPLHEQLQNKFAVEQQQFSVPQSQQSPQRPPQVLAPLSFSSIKQFLMEATAEHVVRVCVTL